MKLDQNHSFIPRHIGPDEKAQAAMLSTLGLRTLGELIDKALPDNIRTHQPLDLPEGMSEAKLLDTAWKLASKNKVFRSFIGQGYYDTLTPSVVLRNILENPGWYTAYTPYQAEISQGRMEALLNYQTMIIDLTGLPIANASLLDEGTAAAEAMHLAFAARKNKTAKRFFVSADVFPQTLEVIRTRALPLDIEVVVGDEDKTRLGTDFFSALVQYPNARGEVKDISVFLQMCKDNQLISVVASDLLALCMLKPPGEMGADVVVGSSQRFGVPFGFGGPHAAFMSTREEFKRLIPGRIIGVSIDSHGQPAMRLALQTREQHIRREKATSNICTAQVLLAVMASMYAVYHGPQGLRAIAERTHSLARALGEGLKRLGFQLVSESVFDTLQVRVSGAKRNEIIERAEHFRVNMWTKTADVLGISLDEVATHEDVETLLNIFSAGKNTATADELLRQTTLGLKKGLLRTSSYLTHPTFNRFHSETEMLRYINRLQAKDLSLIHSMIPLGSCTMKLNATTEMIPITWPEFCRIHPFAPINQAHGFLELIHQLERWLTEITGFAGVSVQPNAGSQGEYAGLLVIREYLRSKGQQQRTVCLIPSSAHGTNPASAVMAGFKVVVVASDEQGNVNLTDLKAKIEANKDTLGALMMTYPSTHGVFEETFSEICGLIHAAGGQVYMDGANMNALVGVSKPGKIGADVCHLNLHKTFCIPHGGGGPGVGPIGVAEHLKEFLPKHSLVAEAGPSKGITSTTSAPWGSAGILPISWAYIAMMGRDGLQAATEVAILNANYIAKKLAPHYKTLYTGKNGFVAHECILDVRPFKDSAGITVDDFAKRLMDFGFHAPTMSWPVVGTLMIEPTESESKEELDRFIEAMIKIRQEIAAVEEGKSDKDNNVLKNAPHCYTHLLGEKWDHPYTREAAAFPLPWVKERKFWVSVGRVDNAHGDKNLVCACLPVDAYQ
ncbi:MAG: aminomethyl-transferring glycine dehydrogenase [Bdellovibrionales bacterium]|nr:aminomethyl-transferring glycine dehydrogenase [Bdellovibrionales bacterium]